MRNDMKKNVGTVDKIIRILIAVVIGILYFTGTITGTLAIILGILAILFVLTSLISFCGIYAIFGCSTCKINQGLKE